MFHLCTGTDGKSVESEQNRYKISFIVPVYNVEAYLERCMASLLLQNMEECEILLIDDGSRDHSGEMCDKYGDENPGVRVFHKQNGGLSSARNYGIERAQGEYLVFVDSDDYVSEDMARILKRAWEFHSGPDVIGFDGLEECGDYLEKIRNVPLEDTRVCCGHDCLLTGYRQRNMNVQVWLYAFRKDFLKKNGLYFREGIYHEDVEFTPRALLQAEKIVLIPENLYYYVVREDSISTGKNKEKNIQDLSDVLAGLCELAEQQEAELNKWMKNAVLDSYLNMIYEFRMYRPEYRRYVEKWFLVGKAATFYNRFRVILCFMNVHLYCLVNDVYKRIGQR